eukprot:SAG25_NODE_343_length_9443_cov_3.590218_15_plen_68_part_00
MNIQSSFWCQKPEGCVIQILEASSQQGLCQGSLTETLGCALGLISGMRIQIGSISEKTIDSIARSSY